MMKASDKSDIEDQDLGALYKQIAEEWDGKDRHEGLFLIAMDEADGDPLQARLIYAQKRLLQLTRSGI